MIDRARGIQNDGERISGNGGDSAGGGGGGGGGAPTRARRLRMRSGPSASAARGIRPWLTALLASPLALAGCSTHRQPFPEVPPEQVWTAMKAAALDPSYSDWIVLENAVAIDDTDRTIEIYRHLRRDYMAPGVKPRREDEEWKFSVALEAPAPPKPPEVLFTIRDASLPADAQREAGRYFEDLKFLLGQTGPQPGGTSGRVGDVSSRPGGAANGPTGPTQSAGGTPLAPPSPGDPTSPTSTGAPSTPSPQPASPSVPPPPVDLPQ